MTGAKTILLFSLWIAAAGASESDALAISANIQAQHLPFGTILDPIFTGTQITGYTRCGDSALWTGSYLAAEAFRYKVTRSADALTNVKNAIAGIKSLVDVTGTDVLARCAVPAASQFAAGIQSEETHNGIFKSGDKVWIGNTSRDEYSGVMFGLSVAFDMVDDAGVQASAAQLITRLVNFLDAHAWTIVMPDGTVSTTFIPRADQMLSFLQVARHVNPGQFSASFDKQSFLLELQILIPIGVDTASDTSYFKFNLDYINLYNLIRLDSNSTGAFRQAYDLLRNHTAGHQNAFFNMIDRALKGPNAARDAETQALLNLWLLRPRRDVSVDLHGMVPVCGGQACQPVPVNLRPPTDFLWQRDPFQLAGGGSGVIESSGIDYILPYWMARSFDVTSVYSVQSAAAGTAGVAPGSIASLFGPGLMGTTQLTVRGVDGVDRAANILYTGAGQVNFIVPGATPAGLATFTFPAGSVQATVQTVAPSLFSMSGNGMGVAAATAIRTQAGNPSLQSPVPVFTCDSAGKCQSVPIDTGLDTPVYLSLYGTGIRGRSSLAKVTATINGISVPVYYAGPQPDFAGLDQVNVGLVLNLRGSGESNVVVTVDGQTSNTVTVNIK